MRDESHEPGGAVPIIGDQPVAGYYAMRLAKHAMRVPIRIWHGAPMIDGEEQDRSPRWCVEIDGETDRLVDGCREPLDVYSAWPYCARHQISEDEYRFLLRRAAWARKHKPDHPAARTRDPIDVRKLPPMF